MSNEYLIPQFIIDYLQKSKSTKNPQKLVGFSLKKNKTYEINNWFKENVMTPSYIWKNFVFYGLNKFSHKECPVCGKRLSIKQLIKGSQFCSIKCFNSSETIKAKIKQNREQTCLKRYGVTSFSKTENFKEKYKQTCLTKYGVENPFQNKEVQEKYKQTCLTKYGVENPSQSNEIQEKCKETFLTNYGVENPSQSREIKEIALKTRRLNHWQTFCSLLKERKIAPLFSKEEYINDTGRKFRCLVCGKEFISEGANNYMLEHKNKDGTHTTLIPYAIFCPHCFKAPYSQKEKEVLEFVRSIYKGEVIENDRTQLNGKELDIFIPALNLGIEFDGDYWHSKEGAKEKDEIKDSLCEERGIKLLRIKESEWDNNSEMVKEKLRRFLN